MDPYAAPMDPMAPHRDPMDRPARQMAWDRAGLGLWWLVAAVGIGLLVLAYVVAFFDRTNHSAAAVFALLGFIVVETGLTLTALLAAGWPWGARVALMITAALLAVRAVGFGGVGSLV
ncbi:MAG TPA: hypothetical protein VM286_05535 [Candidatus Thermoplasmatota archaeon]|nr:hypothetical protein [Candidatus Thermoplasmatota archaeon]